MMYFLKKVLRPQKEIKSLQRQINILEMQVQLLQERYVELLNDIKYLKEENIENSNLYYELSNSIDAVDNRIDILTLEKWNKPDV